MNKNAIKTYAIWARNELITRVTQKAYEYCVSKDNIIDANATSINGKLLTNDEKKQRKQLINDINYKGFDQVIEEVAYTWFNRFIALRYMEVNNYLPNRIRIFTNDNNEFKPQILDEAMNIDLEGLDKELVFELLDKNEKEELYKQLIIATCNDMGNYLPGMFTKISDYRVLLFPNNILKEENVVGKLITDIDEDSWLDQVQIIGWLYQYYVSEKHDEVVNLNINEVRKDEIPAATQLFTTDWVVRYMVDNSLGRYWLERNPNSSLKNELKFLTKSKNDELLFVNENIDCENLTFFDPCMGSGHILVYAFDVLMKIYRECGYSDRDAAQKIIEKNLYGLDIDQRAYQLSYFAVMMKGRSYNRRILTKKVRNNLSDIKETNSLNSYKFEGMPVCDEMDEIAQYLIDIFKDAKELGSLIEVKPYDFRRFEEWLDNLKDNSEYTLDLEEWIKYTYPLMMGLTKQAMVLSKKYKSVTTNPPYLSKMGGKLKKHVTEKYKDFKTDLFSVFIKRNFEMTEKNGYLGFMTPNVWMFLKSYENLRKYIINKKSIVTLIQMAKGAFYKEATVDVCSFVLQNSEEINKGIYIRLADYKGDMDIQEKYTLQAISEDECNYWYEKSAKSFLNISNFPISFWTSDSVLEAFKCGKPLSYYGETRQGMASSDDKRFVRMWHEVNKNKIGFGMNSAATAKASKFKWFPYNKGGNYRKWYGNNTHLINYENDGYEVKKYASSLYKTASRTIKSTDVYFREGGTWSAITSGELSVRWFDKGYVISNAGMALYADSKEQLLYFIGLLNSKVTVDKLIKSLNESLNFNAGDISRIPILYDHVEEVNKLVMKSILLSKEDWDLFEISWDFNKHPFINALDSIEDSYNKWKRECEERFFSLKDNEEELNRIFIDIYKLHNELNPDIEAEEVTVRKADLSRDIKSFISYSVGCMFGRYSLDLEGLAYAGGEWKASNYKSFIPDSDNIIPICDDEYFEDDIVGRFIEFVKTVYGEDTVEENLKFIADALGGKGTPREVLRNYFLNDFFKDHCNTYQVTGSGKRPIYWLFDSGKKNGFKALIYIHRYTPDLIARMRTKYIHEQQSRYRNQIEMLEKQVESDISTSERVRLTKQLKKFKEQDEELRVYEEKIHHWADKMEPMDLDDGVKVNYAKFQELLAKIK